MRMLHYYLVPGIILVPSLLATLATGIWHDGSQQHLAIGLFTAILCVAQNTLLILFMIVTGRVLKVAMKSRPLGDSFLAELNRFFAERKAYPLALIAATLAVSTAVLGYGALIGVPMAVHLLLGLITVLVNLVALGAGVRTIRANQALLDRAVDELDRLDAEGFAPVDQEIGEPEWAFPRTTRWLIFAASAWMPYLYWGFVVWHGDFARVSSPFLAVTALASAVCFIAAWRGRVTAST